MTQRRATALVVGASLGGLLAGAAVPAARHLAPATLLAVFVQTLVAVGALAGPAARESADLRRSARLLVLHHLVTSAPLMGLGLLLGLGTPLGTGAFLLGAVPPAAGLPGYAAACGVRVHLVLGYCLLGYGVGVFATPLLVVSGVGGQGGSGRIVLVLVFGLVAPALLARAGHRWLARLGRRWSFAAMAASIALLTLGLGPDLRQAVEDSSAHPGVLLAAAGVALGRTVVTGALCAALAAPGSRREFVLVGAYKNAALAAVLALGVSTPLAALPALLSLFGEALVLLALAQWGARAPG